ncbi:DcaP family trimeric outer membrane transporter [Rhodopirellula sp. P2]|uniref:DcaP family trimeric outer membrane transporter n=1 Tax=Rhodopirellula sp. P2 TaxID=2127060 RepID=UPI0023677F71|nr:DcaP family trimeric outer membrane transporter [Rhodopirellula sp. P2]WDQ17830.1 DcaP family trimeric outer membrane transporter [Rhodopirellula sp. P2]
MSCSTPARTIDDRAIRRWILFALPLCFVAVSAPAEESLATLLQVAEAEHFDEPLLLAQFSEFNESLDAIESPVTEVLDQLEASSLDRSMQQSFTSASFDSGRGTQQPNNFTAFPDFNQGIIVLGEEAALKIGGFVKADFITDFDPIDSVDSFDTSQIPVGAADRKNSRFHARSSRLSFDTRWKVQQEVVRAFVEADFFGGEDGANGSLRLRHAYGTMGYITAGQTWTTFTHPSAVPQTLDFEGAVSNVNRRQGLVRLDLPLGDSGWSWAVSLEDPRIQIDIPIGVTGEGRTESPDVITHLKLERDRGDFQAAFVMRELGFQPVGDPVITGTAWGFNFTGSGKVTEDTRLYSQITFGEGIGSYRGSPDVVSTGPSSAAILPMFGWMVGCKHVWNERLTSNLTYSELLLDPIAGQDPTNLRQTNYLAVNLIHNPVDRVFVGIEYLYGMRENQNGNQADATRLQMTFGFYLP